PGEAEKIFQSSPLPLRNFHFPSRLLQLAACRDGMYFAMANKESGSAFKVICHLDRELDALLFRTLQEQARHLPGVRDGAAILLDSGSGKVLAMVGTLDFASAQAGQVNAALAVRSAGSTLKPFLYAEAIDGGILVEDSILLDAPVRYGEYSPSNYDGRFHGRITAGEALSLSLNTPAVRLLAALKPKRLAERFTSLHLWTSPAAAADSTRHQLAMTLGTAGHSLLGLTTAYATLARGGDFVPAQFSDSGQAARKPIFTPGCCAMLSQMLRRRPLPSSSLAVSWKTGTSNGNHDAWCFAYTPEFTVGIWFGNKDGAPAAVLTGAGAAAPAAAAIMSALYRNHPPPAWPPTDELFQVETLCADSGLSASASCQERCSGTVLRDIPLRQCPRCQKNKRGSALMILSPTPGQYIADTKTQTAMLALRAQPTDVLWYVNNRYIGPLTNTTRLPFAVGRHVLHAIDDKNQEQSASVKFSVTLP
ncbi:MAG: penicillin-binding transpeptidase domain-containing protein, partial [Lentisphaeria bacterium]